MKNWNGIEVPDSVFAQCQEEEELSPKLASKEAVEVAKAMIAFIEKIDCDARTRRRAYRIVMIARTDLFSEFPVGGSLDERAKAIEVFVRKHQNELDSEVREEVRQLYPDAKNKKLPVRRRESAIELLESELQDWSDR